MKTTRRFWLQSVGATGLLFLFNNCSSGFKSLSNQNGQSSASTSTPSSPTPSPTNPTSTPTPVPINTPPPTNAPAWMKNASVYEWLTLPSLSASSVLPNPLPPGSISAVTDAWGGGALRTKGSFYILHGGGHGDYAGNEIYALSLEADSPQWQRVWGPTPNSQIVTGQNYYLDGSPASMHTYHLLMFDDQDDVFMRFARSWYSAPSGAEVGLDGWKWAAPQWEDNSKNIIWPPEPDGMNYQSGLTKDLSGNVYMTNGYDRIVWSRSNNTWSIAISGSSVFLGQNGLAFDSKRNVIWSFGGGGAGAVPQSGQAYQWNVTANSDQLFSLQGPYANAVDANNANFSGAVYDPVSDTVFVITGDGQIYSFNPSTYAVNQIATTGATLPNTQSSSATAPWGKFQYVPNLGGVVIQPLWAANTYFMRTH